MEVVEVFELIDGIALRYIVEHCVAQDSADEENEHEQDKDVEKRADRHHDRLQKALEILSLASQAKHTTDAQDAKHTSELRTH